MDGADADPDDDDDGGDGGDLLHPFTQMTIPCRPTFGKVHAR